MIKIPGEAQRKYVGELMRFEKTLKRTLNLIFDILPEDYNEEDILNLFKKFYPFEWETICERYQTYCEKDDFLVKQGKKRRYKPLAPHKYFFSLPKVKHMLSSSQRKWHKEHFDLIAREKKLDELEKKRTNQLNKRNLKIQQAKMNLQEVEPMFLDALIAAYHRKGNTIEDKLEIIKEIQKYDCPESVRFFRKINDSERNNQVRKMAFDYLQKTGSYVKLRKNFSGKTKIYMTEKSSFYMTPKDLVDRLEHNQSIQLKKSFDVFISHSSKDASAVRRIMQALNKQGLVCYCDWTSDNDFLKRNLVSEYTREVLKKRMIQSIQFLLVRSENSDASEWVSFEMKFYSENVNKMKMHVIDIGTEDIDINKLQKLHDVQE